jgi:hypothetical protein
VDGPLSDSIVPIAESTVQGGPGQAADASWYRASIPARVWAVTVIVASGTPASRDTGARARRPPTLAATPLTGR